MPRKKKIKVIPKQEDAPPIQDVKSHNFWNTCPRKLELMPEKPCAIGARSVCASSAEKEECPWGVNSKKHNYCFWKWLAANSSVDGFMEAKKQDEVAALLKWSSTKVHFTCRSAIQNIKRGPYAKILAELNPGTNSTPESDSDFNFIANSVPSNRDDDY